MLRWFFTVWLGFVVLRYGSTVLKSLRSPFNNGLDIEWAGAWLAFLLIAVVSVIFVKRVRVLRIWLALTMLVTISVVVISQSSIPAVKALTIIAVSAGIGEVVLRRLGFHVTGLIECIVLTVPMGIAVLALGQLALAIAGLFTPFVTWIFVGLLAIPAAAGIRQICRLKFEKGIGQNPLLVIPLAFVFFLNLLWALAPEIQFDATSAHLAIPQIYLQHGGVVNLTYFWHSYFAHLLDYVYGLCLALGGPLVAKILVLHFSLIAAGGVFIIGQRLFTDEVGLWSALIFYSTPLVIWSSGTTYLDLSETCFIVAAIVSFIRWFETRSPAGVAVTGWISGVAVGTKLHALSVLGVIPLAILWYQWKRNRMSAIKSVVIYGLMLVAIAAPWYSVVYAYTGNPIYPFMNAVFRSPQWEPVNTRLNFDEFGIGSSPYSLLKLPFWLTWDTIRFGDPLPRGGMGFGILLGFPFALLVLFRTRPRVIRVLLLAIVLHFLFWALSVQYGRYYLPGLPLMILVGSSLFLDKFNHRWNRVLMFVGVLAQVPVASMQFWQLEERYPLEHAIGKEDHDHLLDRGLAGHAGVRYINNLIKPGEKVVAVSMEPMRFYLKAPLHTLAESVRGEELNMMAGMRPGPRLATALTGSGFAYVMAPVRELKNPPPYYPYLQPEFLREFTTEAYRDNSVAVFKVCADPCQE